MFAQELASRAREYLDAARAVGTTHPAKLVHPTYFLVAHSVELSLKAFLASNGDSKVALKEIGHRLPRLMSSARDKGLPDIEYLPVLIRHLSTINTGHNLRYPAGYIQSVMRLDQAAEIAENLLDIADRSVAPVYLHDRLTFLQQYQDKYVEWSD